MGLIAKTSPIGELIWGNPVPEVTADEAPDLNEQQRKILRQARWSDLNAQEKGQYGGYEEDFRAKLLARQAAQRRMDADLAEAGARAFAGGGTITPEQAAAAVRAGTPYDPAMLNPDQVALMKEQDRLRYAGRYGNISDQTGLYNATKPQLQVWQDNRVYDANDASNLGKTIPKLDAGMEVDANGRVTYSPGYVGSKAQLAGSEAAAQESAKAAYAGQIAGAQEAAKAQYDLVQVPGADGRIYYVPRAQAGGMAAQRSPVEVGNDQVVVDATKKRWETAQAQAQNAGTIRQNAILLRDLSRSTGGGAFTPLKSAASNVLVSLGVAGPDAEQYASDVRAFTTIAGGQVLANLRQFGANPTEGERNFALSLGSQATDLPGTVEATTAAAISTANKADAYWKWLQTYNGDPRKVDEAWGQTPYGKYGFFADPEMQTWIKSRGGIVQVNQKTGQLRIQMPNGQKVGDW